mgnify:CR=1 FL=1
MKDKVINDINSIVNFVLIEGTSKKNNKPYYYIAFKLNEEYVFLKFLTEKQKDAIMNQKKGD